MESNLIDEGSRGMYNMHRLDRNFYLRDVLEVAPDLVGKVLVRKFDDENTFRSRIIEVEAYRGGEDLACHASRGRTARTEVMFHAGGRIYLYLIYGMYWMLNFVTGLEDEPQAVLIRGLSDVCGPGRITRTLRIDKSYYGEDLVLSDRIWLENHDEHVQLETGPRIGIDYAGDYWKSMPWRFTEVPGKVL